MDFAFRTVTGMKISVSAVVLDLPGVLVPASRASWATRIPKVASALLDVPFRDASTSWEEAQPALLAGETTPGEWARTLLGDRAVPHLGALEAFETAAAAAVAAPMLRPAPGALLMLLTLNHHRIPALVVGNAPGTVRDAWLRSQLSLVTPPPVLSCDVGTTMPALSFYADALDAIGFDPADCAFVADGDSGELDGARLAGFGHVIQMAQMVEDPKDVASPPVEDWEGLTVRDHVGLLDLLGFDVVIPGTGQPADAA